MVPGGVGSRTSARGLLVAGLASAPLAAAAAPEVVESRLTGWAGGLDVHAWVFALCLLLLVVSFSAMFYSVFAYRRANGGATPRWHKNTLVELMWTVVPVFILFGSAWPAMRSILDSTPRTAQQVATVPAASRDARNPGKPVPPFAVAWAGGATHVSR